MKNDIFLTSKLDLYTKDSFNNKIPKILSNDNDIINNFIKCIKQYKNFLYIANTEKNYKLNDEYANITFKSFGMTLPFENYYILDGRTLNKADWLIKNADFIFISGGNVPSQNDFIKKINLSKMITKTTAVICSVSAGTMNCAEIVYCPPENEEELNNQKFKKKYNGLGLTKLNILPHYNVLKNIVLCNKKYIEDIIFPDSYVREIYALPDYSYIHIKDNNVTYYGIVYLIKDGQIKPLNYKNDCIRGEYE